ncbi:hypothetical protein LJC59_01015 [Desulfovibrio sp. OttesenSCG-928-A18]|nr:hypothetical protein [Desulfovibrio sp. OttesenSCG-928-A18]
MSQAKQCGTGANVGIDTEVIFHPKTAREIKLPGLNNAQLPGWNTEQITDDSFDKEIAGIILGGLSYQPASMSVYMRSQDPAQEEIRVMSRERREFNDIWIVYNKKYGHFWALDLVRDPCGLCGLSNYAPQSYGRNDLQQIQFTLTANGDSALYEYHTTSVQYDIAAGVATATDGDFVNRGFKKGMTLIMETGDQTSPFVLGLVAEVTATTLTLTDTSITQAGLEGRIHGAVVSLED